MQKIKRESISNYEHRYIFKCVLFVSLLMILNMMLWMPLIVRMLSYWGMWEGIRYGRTILFTLTKK